MGECAERLRIMAVNSSSSFLSELSLKHLCSGLLLFITLFGVPRFAQAGVALTAGQRRWLAEHPVIRLAPDPDFAPIEFFEDGEYVGLAADYIDLIERALGIEFEIVHLENWQAVIEAARAREVDMYGAAMESPERLEYMLFTEPHIKVDSVIVVREETEGALTLEDLAGWRVSVVEGYALQEFLAADHPEIEMVPVQSTLDALRQVSFGSVDAMVGDMATATHALETSGISNLRVAGELGRVIEFSIASRNDWPELNTILNAALASIPREQRQAITRRWIYLRASNVATAKHGTLLALVGALIILVLLAGGFLWVNLRGQRVAALQRAAIEVGTDFDAAQDLVRNRRRILIQTIATMSLIALGLAVVANWILYSAAFRQRERSLREIVTAQAGLINAVARFDRIHSQEDVHGGSVEATLSQVRESMRRMEGLGETGEIDVARLVDGWIVPIHEFRHQVGEAASRESLSATGPSEFMRRALRGESGSMVGLDYRGEEVLAAYEPIGELNAGIVAKIDLSEIRSPFIRAGLVTFVAGLILVFTGGFTLVWMNSPLLKRVEESERRFRSLVGNIPGVTYRCLMDRDWTMLFISDAIENLTGYPPSDFLVNSARTFDSVIHPDDRTSVAEEIERAVANRRAWNIEYRVLHCCGEVRWVSETGRAIHNETTGEVAWLDGAIFDISEKHRAEMAIAHAEERSRMLLESTQEGIFGVDADGMVTFVNPSAARLLDREQEEILGQEIHSLAHHSRGDGSPYPVEECPMNRAFMEGVASRIDDEVMWRRDGSSFDVEYTSVPIRRDREIIGAVVVFRDIGERRRMEDELHRAKEAAEEASRAKSEFLANMSHEIRTPMNAILGFSDLLKQSDLPAKDRSHLDAIASSGRSLLTLINDILDLSKVEAGKLELQYTSFNLGRLLEECRTVFLHRAQAKGLRLELQVDSELPRWFFLDEVRLRQIIFNIVGNALKFTHEGSVTIRARGRIKPEQADRFHLILEVIDTGIGIPKDQQANIFESFSQVSGQSTRKYGGTGLGLAISKRLTEMMGGLVSLKSAEGEGSTFRFDFPTVMLTAEHEDAEVSGADHRLDQIVPSTILCADDEPLNRALMQGFFDGTGHTLFLAENGREAVEIEERERPDLILMDIRMPVMDGTEATRIIKAKRNIPILALTASSMKEQQVQFEKVCDLHLTKPISISDLAQAIKRFLPVIDESVETPVASEPEENEAATEVVLNPKITAEWPELLNRLEEIRRAELPALCDAPNMAEVEEFGRRAMQWGEEYQAPPLIQFSKRLIQRVEEFDIEAISRTLRSFDQVIDEIRKGMMSHGH